MSGYFFDPDFKGIAWVHIIKVPDGFKWQLVEDESGKIIARSSVVFHGKLPAFIAGADRATALSYIPRDPSFNHKSLIN